MAAVAIDRLWGEESSVAVKAPCATVATANIALTGLQTISGIPLAEGDRCLVAGQTDATQNGIYNASASAWRRAGDFDNNRDAVNGSLVACLNATVPFYRLVAANPVTIGTTPLVFQQLMTVALPYQLGDVRLYGAVGNGVADDTAAFVAAHTALSVFGGRIYAPGIGAGYLITGALNFTKAVELVGDGYSIASGANAPTKLIKHSSVSGPLITLSAVGSTVRDLTCQGVAGNTGDGIQQAAGRCTIQNVGCFLMGGNGIRIGTDGAENCNVWSLFNVHCSSNGAAGIYVSSHTPGTSPDCNGGTLHHANCSSNGTYGVYLNNVWMCSFYGLTVQTNTTYGVYLSQYADRNSFFGGDWGEANGTADARFDNGAADNLVLGVTATISRFSGDTASQLIILNDSTLGVGTQQFWGNRAAANYMICRDAAGYWDFVTGGLTPSDANSSLRLHADGTVVIGRGGGAITKILKGTAAWDPANIADGAVTNSPNVAVVGAAIGDQVICGFDQAVPALAFMVGSVTAADTVVVTLYNHTGGALNLAAGNVKVTVIKQ